MSYTSDYFKHVKTIADSIDPHEIDRFIAILNQLQRGPGRLFILGVGGSAANCSHATNDFRKIAGIETYAPTDNVSELTARTNDEGWHTVFSEYLRVSRLSAHDAILILSVGGGNKANNISTNLCEAIDLAKERDAQVLGIVSRDGGYTKAHADACIVIPTLDQDMITPLAEAWQGVIWHLLVSHPEIKKNQGKWESVETQRRSRSGSQMENPAL